MPENQFIQPDQILPGDQDTEILGLSAEPYPDKRRVSVKFRLSSFQVPPNVAVSLKNEVGEELAAVKIVNMFDMENEITLHLPQNKNQQGEYFVDLHIFSLEEVEKKGEEGQVVALKETNIKSRSCSFTLQ